MKNNFKNKKNVHIKDQTDISKNKGKVNNSKYNSIINDISINKLIEMPSILGFFNSFDEPIPSPKTLIKIIKKIIKNRNNLSKLEIKSEGEKYKISKKTQKGILKIIENEFKNKKDREEFLI